MLALRIVHKFQIFKDAHPELNDSHREELRNIMIETCITRFQKFKELTAPLDRYNPDSVLDAANKLAEFVNQDIELDQIYFKEPFAQ